MMKKSTEFSLTIGLIILLLIGGLTVFSWKNTSKSTNNANKNSSSSSTQPIASYRINNNRVYVYGRKAALYGKKRVPLVLFMHGTGGDPQKEAIRSGWAAKAKSANILVISPTYDDYVTYDNVPFISKVVRYAQSHYSVDPHRTYSLGFSNGGATSIAMVNEHPRMFAGIAAYGWANDLTKKKSKYLIPFQFISGSREATEYTSQDNPMVRVDVRTAIQTLFRYNNMKYAGKKANYQQTPYWGYTPDKTTRHQTNGTIWTVNDYYKKGYEAPFAQFVMVAKAIHEPHKAEANYSWNFLKHFSRNSAGKIIEN
ncbi:alpha/beta hydrolase family esterase [Lactobacillus corticis]|uniref:Peptidase S9 prolyl oligopeptidase catalytic domain-containing protein n=1 Tax=Lactobacillus corticis TaxID=2201249 RepID=A0A916QJ69_9LACO|nr:prolyl oligopeptidase family serine peptidase [Lactobacillus corticis]GFZ26553.1 hypothetical protein LCB40_04330 [Lactobacillus corticis]